MNNWENKWIHAFPKWISGKLKAVSSSIWTWVTDSISNDDNYDAKHALNDKLWILEEYLGGVGTR